MSYGLIGIMTAIYLVVIGEDPDVIRKIEKVSPGIMVFVITLGLTLVTLVP